MTVTSTQSAISVAATGASQYQFPFVAVSASDISVLYNGVTLPNTAYTVTINAPVTGQIWGVGGTINPVVPANYSTGTLTIVRTLPFTQTVDVSNQGNQYPIVTEQALDTLCMEIQQVAARTGAYRGTWVSGATYNFGDIVQDGANGAYTNNLYTATTGNVSGVWATDLANGVWSLALNIQTISAGGSYLPLTGGTVSGNLVVSGTLTAANPALTGTAASLSIGGNAATATTSTSAASATNATNVSGGTVSTSSLNGGQLAGLRNRTINGDMRIDQRNNGASQTITAAASAAYTVDRFYATCTGANVTGQRVTGSGVDQYAYQFTGAVSVTAIAFGQRYEATNVYDLAGTTATFSVKLANSLLTTVTWTAYYPTSIDTWTGRTQIATGTFTVSSTATKYSTQIALPSNVTTGLEIELSVGAQISGTFTISEWQIENGIVATPFERRPIGDTLAKCQRYYQKSYNQNVVPGATYTAGNGSILWGSGTSGGVQSIFIRFASVMRAATTVVLYDAAGNSNKISYYASGWNNNGAPGAVTAFDNAFITSFGSGSITANLEYTASAEL